jgi:hypothetical protein
MSSTSFKDQAPTNITTNNMDESSESGNFSDSDHEMNDTSSVEDQKVTAVVAVIDTFTEDPASGIEHSKRCRRTNKLLFTKKIKVLLDSGSDGDIWFHKIGATKLFPYTERQMAKSYHTSAGVFHKNGQATSHFRKVNPMGFPVGNQGMTMVYQIPKTCMCSTEN